jgi:hypothetical protein
MGEEEFCDKGHRISGARRRLWGGRRDGMIKAGDKRRLMRRKEEFSGKKEDRWLLKRSASHCVVYLL